MPDKPFPTNEADTNLLFQTMKTQLPLVAGQLVLAPNDLAFFEKQAVNYQYIVNITQDISDQREAFTAWKRSILEGDPTKPAPVPPTFPIVVLPQTEANGLEATAKAIIKRIKASPGYNDTIGEQLGLVDSGPAPFNPNDLFAALKPSSKPGSVVEFVFSKQGMDAMRVERQRKGETTWSLAGVFTSSPASDNAPPAVPDEPESRSYRSILVRKNLSIGNYSPIYTVVTTP